MTPDTRRAIRTAVHTIGALSMLGMLAWIVHLLGKEPTWLGWIAMGLIAILFWRELFHGLENVAARIKFHVGKDGMNGEIEK